jgi:hypothetical protein
VTTTAAPPVEPPLGLKRVVMEQFTPEALRHLASLKEAERPRLIARRNLSPASVEELAAMLAAGRRPTIGWWMRHRTEDLTP